jgi:hypothetical protein
VVDGMLTKAAFRFSREIAWFWPSVCSQRYHLPALKQSDSRLSAGRQEQSNRRMQLATLQV